jgi:hypothetical protein
MKLTRVVTVLIFFFGISTTILGQDYASWGKLEGGKYKVGFRTIKTYDSTRTYKPEEGLRHRPLLIHLWYPTSSSSKDYMKYKSYIMLETQREHFSNNNFEDYCNRVMQGYIDYGKKLMGNLDVTSNEVLSSPTAPISNAEPTIGKFPLIIYAPSFGKSSIQNNIGCEYLASHGYIVASVASAGENSQVMTTDEIGVMAQVQDIEFLINYLEIDDNIDLSKIGTFGYSWGGFSNIIHQMRNDYVKAVASWDGSIEYHGYEIAKKMKDFNSDKLKVPYIFFSNKNEDYTEFPFYKSVSSNKKYLYRLKKLEHAEFTSYWTNFSNAKENASSYDLESYKNVCEYTLVFFDIYLKDKKSMVKKLQNLNTELITNLNTN